MRKSEVIKEISARTNLRAGDVKLVLDTLAEIMREKLSKGERINLAPIGIFKVKELKPTKIRHIKTRQLMEIPARKKVQYTPHSSMIIRR